MAQVYYPNSYALVIADTVAALFDDCVVKLWQSGLLTPSVNTTVTECDSAECTFSGYASKTVAELAAPYLSPDGGAATESGLVQFLSTTGSPFVENIVGGFWVETAAGVLQLVGKLDSNVPISAPSQAVPINFAQVFCRPPSS